MGDETLADVPHPSDHPHVIRTARPQSVPLAPDQASILYDPTAVGGRLGIDAAAERFLMRNVAMSAFARILVERGPRMTRTMLATGVTSTTERRCASPLDLVVSVGTEASVHCVEIAHAGAAPVPATAELLELRAFWHALGRTVVGAPAYLARAPDSVELHVGFLCEPARA